MTGETLIQRIRGNSLPLGFKPIAARFQLFLTFHVELMLTFRLNASHFS